MKRKERSVWSRHLVIKAVGTNSGTPDAQHMTGRAFERECVRILGLLGSRSLEMLRYTYNNHDASLSGPVK